MRFKYLLGYDPYFYLAYIRYSNYDYTGLFASLNDSYENITLILTGSEIQILEEFLGFNDRYSPLYKREHEIVHLDRFSRGESIQYLRGIQRSQHERAG